MEGTRCGSAGRRGGAGRREEKPKKRKQEVRRKGGEVKREEGGKRGERRRKGRGEEGKEPCKGQVAGLGPPGRASPHTVPVCPDPTATPLPSWKSCAAGDISGRVPWGWLLPVDDGQGRAGLLGRRTSQGGAARSGRKEPAGDTDLPHAHLPGGTGSGWG